MQTFNINSNNNLDKNNNTYRYDFINGGINIAEDSSLSCNQIIVPNSVANVSQNYNNLTFAYSLQGQSYVGGSQLSGTQIAFTVNSTIVNTNVVSLNITTGFLYTGYIVYFTGLTTTNPIYITNIALADVNSATASVTLNQNISVSASTSGSAYIVGNNVIIQTSTGVPIVNMLLEESSLYNATTSSVVNFLNATITNVVPKSATVSNTIYLVTYSKSIPAEAQVTRINNSTQARYVSQVTLQNGYYDITALNKALQSTLYNNGHFIFYNTVSTAGEVSQNISYPMSLALNSPVYSFSLNCTSLPAATSLITTYGTNSGINFSGVLNPNFDNVIISNSSSVAIVTGTNQSATSQLIYGWTASTTIGSGASTIVRLVNSDDGIITVPPPSPYTQFIGLKTAISTDKPTITTTSTSYYPAGTYTCSFYAAKSSTGTVTQLTINFDTTYTITLTDNYNWNKYSFTFTTAGANLSLSFTTVTNQANDEIGVTGIGFYNSLYPVSPLWKYGFVGGQPNLCLNFYQTSTGYNITNSKVNYTYSNPYSLNNYLIANNSVFQFYTTFRAQSIGVTIPPYGLAMQPVTGLMIRADMINNPAIKLTDVVNSFALTSTFGSNNIYQGEKTNYVIIKKGRYRNVTFTICDSNGVPIVLLDNNILFSFYINAL